MDILSIPSNCGEVNAKGIPCIRVIIMKKTEYITFRTDSEAKEVLAKYAAERKWSISLLVEDIIQQWIRENGLRQEPAEE